MNFPSKSVVVFSAALAGCSPMSQRILDDTPVSIFNIIATDTTNPYISYYPEGINTSTWTDIICDFQVAFDKTTGKKMEGIFPDKVIDYIENQNDEGGIICNEDI